MIRPLMTLFSVTAAVLVTAACVADAPTASQPQNTVPPLVNVAQPSPAVVQPVASPVQQHVTMQTPMLVRTFAQLSDQDANAYIQDMRIRAEKLFTDAGKADLAKRTHDLFTTRLGNDQITVGISQILQNMALLKDLDIEDVFEKTLVDNGIGVQVDPKKPNLIGLPETFFTRGVFTTQCPLNPTLARYGPTGVPLSNCTYG